MSQWHHYTFSPITTLLSTALLAASAGAGVTYDFAFRPGGGGAANGAQYTFASVTAARSGQPVMDVFLRTTASRTLPSPSRPAPTTSGPSSGTRAASRRG